MGKGSSTNKTNIIKHPANYKSDVEATGMQGVGAERSISSRPNACLLTFKDNINVNQDATDLIKVGLIFMLVPSEKGQLMVVSSGRQIGSYSGGKSALLKRCIQSGYIYRGKVLSVNVESVQCEITGMGVNNGTAATL